METETKPNEQGARKPCVACGEMIPVNATICSHCQQRQVSEKRSPWKMIMGWVAGASALVGLFASLSGQFHFFAGKHEQKAEVQAKMAVAESQAKQREYESAVQTYGAILKENPLYRPAQEEQLDAAMAWVENFQVLGRDDEKASTLAATKLDEIMPVLDAGMARWKEAKNGTDNSRAADVQAHLGWAHWLNWHIAEREYGPKAEENLRASVALDPTNVYGNAMLGNWMLQSHANFADAIGYLNKAVATGNARPLVRQMQLGGLIYNDASGARRELMRAVDDMRKNNEPLDEEEKQRILGFCCSPSATDQGELTESLSAVSEGDAWKTYLWLDDRENDDSSDKTQTVTRDFIRANLLEIAGKRSEALAKYRLLQQEAQGGSMRERANDAVKRLSRG